MSQGKVLGGDRAKTYHVGLALELEDREVAVALEHQARLVVGRADPLLGEQGLARREVREAVFLGFLSGPRHFGWLLR